MVTFRGNYEESYSMNVTAVNKYGMPITVYSRGTEWRNAYHNTENRGRKPRKSWQPWELEIFVCMNMLLQIIKHKSNSF